MEYIIISGANENRYNANKNHELYAAKHNVDYKFCIRNNISSPYYIKIYLILEYFGYGYENILWLDDDAFFVDLGWDFKKIFNEHSESFIVTKSPNKRNNLPLFNSGVMFIKNNTRTKEFLNACLLTSYKTLSNNWNTEKYGNLSGDDQARLIYNSDKMLKNDTKIIDFPGFNGRRKQFAFDTPIVHFVSKNKEVNIQKFQKKTGINLYELD